LISHLHHIFNRSPVIQSTGLWSDDGWLGSGGLKAIDFAGSGVVHMTGGSVALAASIVLGPRLGRFVDGRAVEIPGHSIALAALGVVTLWFGWFAFNGGSTFGLTQGRFTVAERAIVNTALSPAVAGMITLFYHKLRYREYNVGKIFNGILGGAVFITASCGVVGTDDAIIAGGKPQYPFLCTHSLTRSHHTN
jgi:Amt family ammonium transporter